MTRGTHLPQLTQTPDEILLRKELKRVAAERDELQRRLTEASQQLAEYRQLWGDMYARRSSAG